ncbi:hypothetical protein EB796_024864 [Bugula neritina]|uniref:Uncharacterized protein n=1 Tax=Bugula neritina TaxID=10212 RepID=A0A7J7ITU5_BUGNE|nr:hypothetical protein EB796_024864 [Bugula neritina]
MPEFSETCVNDGDFCVYVFYSGHGCSGDEKMDIPYGSWVPSATFSDDGETMSAVDFISQDDLNQILTPIRRCTSENDQCSGACIEVVYVMDYCRPPRAVTVASNSGLATWSLEQTPSTAIVASEFNKEAFTMLKL